MPKYYQVVIGNVEVHKIVEKSIPRGDPKRFNKPDDSWFQRIPNNYPRGVYFWTEVGIKKYYESGLLDWHLSVVKGEPFVIVVDKPKKIFFTADYRVVADPASLSIKGKHSLEQFLRTLHQVATS